jgi:CheY-like chemotaxis protein
MSAEGRILTIEDERQWRENFAAWIPTDVAAQDSAATAAEAAEKLRRFHYDLVLLDLSMDVSDSSNRDTRSIQDYLSVKPKERPISLCHQLPQEKRPGTLHSNRERLGCSLRRTRLSVTSCLRGQ